MHSKPVILWFQNELRIQDQPLIAAAHELQTQVICLYIWSPEEEGSWPLGSASKWWLHHTLQVFQDELKKLDLNLTIRKGPTLETLQKIIQETRADTVLLGRRYEPFSRKRETVIKQNLSEAGIKVKSFNTSLLFEPWNILNKQKKPFQVFTPFWRTCLQAPSQRALFSPPKKLPPFKTLESLKLADLGLLPSIQWYETIQETWQPGCVNGFKQLHSFLKNNLEKYHLTRDLPSEPQGVSHLSPYLHFGEISPQQIWHALHANEHSGGATYLKELGWREFAYHLLYHFPETPEVPLKPQFLNFPWNHNSTHLKKWQKGMTGYPIVDAGMRELWQTGWMHNRVRMIVASFLVKDLLIPWQEGAKWFWDTLLDADLANNTLGWQWVAGCGADAAPYFRIFNPTLQGEKFDPLGVYVKKWVPELQYLEPKWIHRPWEAPLEILKNAKLTLGVNYPLPIVDHQKAKIQALNAYRSLK